jgi:SAM-dependent methyltransferase
VYSREFFRDHVAGSRQSAQIIVPLVVELIRPNSVVDVGCGLGTWLAVFERNGVTDVLGVDVDYIDGAQRLIAEHQFMSIDLTKQFHIHRSFDLVVCLEVAEHLPESSAEDFVTGLVSLGKIILFSAAIPGQGGTHHVNEQWPTYWKSLFEKHNYQLIDCFRPALWNNDLVQIHYRQNMFVYAAAEVIERRPTLIGARDGGVGHPVSVVHPALWEAHLKSRPTVGGLFRALPGAIHRSLRKRVLKR